MSLQSNIRFLQLPYNETVTSCIVYTLESLKLQVITFQCGLFPSTVYLAIQTLICR